MEKKLYCNKDHLARASKLEKREKSAESLRRSFASS